VIVFLSLRASDTKTPPPWTSVYWTSVYWTSVYWTSVFEVCYVSLYHLSSNTTTKKIKKSIDIDFASTCI